MPKCRHCKKSFELKNRYAVTRRHCYDPECVEAEKERQKAFRAKWYEQNKPDYHSKYQGPERRSYRRRGKKGGEQWPCQDCGEMSSNRLHCPSCRSKRLASAGNCEGDHIYGISPDDRKEEYYERW